MALTYYRGNVNLPSGGDPIAAVADALRERNLRKQQLEDEARRHAAERERVMFQEQLVGQRQKAMNDADNATALEMAKLKKNDDADAIRKEQQRAIPMIQKAMAAGDHEGAKAIANSVGISDWTMDDGNAAPDTQPRQPAPQSSAPKDYEQAPAEPYSDAPTARAAPSEAYGQSPAEPFADAKPQRELPPDMLAQVTGTQPLPPTKRQARFSVGGQPQTMSLGTPRDLEGDAQALEEYATSTDPVMQRAYKAGIREIRAGGAKAGDVRRQLAELDARIRGQNAVANRPRSPGRDPSLAANRDSRQDENSARQYGKDMLSSMGYREEQGKTRKFMDIASTMTKGNAALDAAAAGTFVKVAQGGTGVISDSDMNVFWNKLGGLGVRGEEGIQAALTGTMGPEKRRIVADAVKELAATAQRNMNAMRLQFREGYKQSKNYSEYGPQMEAAFFGKDSAAEAEKKSANVADFLNKVGG